MGHMGPYGAHMGPYTRKFPKIPRKFLGIPRDLCGDLCGAYDKRTKDRLTEIDAVSDTIKILNSDESFEAFDKMVAPQWLQWLHNGNP